MWAVCAAGGGGGAGGRLPAPVIVVYDDVCGLYVLQEAVEALVADYQRRLLLCMTMYLDTGLYVLQEAVEALVADYLRRLLCMPLCVGCMCCRRPWRRWWPTTCAGYCCV